MGQLRFHQESHHELKVIVHGRELRPGLQAVLRLVLTPVFRLFHRFPSPGATPRRPHSPQRYAELSESIHQQLAAIADPPARLQWLSQHLDIYLARLEAAAKAGLAPEALQRSDLFLTVVAATDALGSQLTADSSAPLLQAWHSLDVEVKRLTDNGSIDSTAGARAALTLLASVARS